VQRFLLEKEFEKRPRNALRLLRGQDGFDSKRHCLSTGLRLQEKASKSLNKARKKDKKYVYARKLKGKVKFIALKIKGWSRNQFTYIMYNSFP